MTEVKIKEIKETLHNNPLLMEIMSVAMTLSEEQIRELRLNICKLKDREKGA
jgi:hypothetical protein